MYKISGKVIEFIEKNKTWKSEELNWQLEEKRLTEVKVPKGSSRETHYHYYYFNSYEATQPRYKLEHW